MESSNLNSINDVETDRASFLPTEEITCEEVRNFAGDKQEYRISYPPEPIPRRLPTNFGQTIGAELYQCSMNRLDYGSGSDSAEEEHSPYSSKDNLKYEGFAPTGNLQETYVLRTRPSSPPDAADATVNVLYTRSKYPQSNIGQHTSEPLSEETGYNEATEALALTGSLRKMSPNRQMSRSNLVPHGEMETPFYDHVNSQRVAVGSDIQGPENSKFEDVSTRLATFFAQAMDWPHETPSPEQMARAGMIYEGVFTINGGKKVYDMVKCYKCGNTLYGFTIDDDPVVEHRKYFPHCN